MKTAFKRLLLAATALLLAASTLFLFSGCALSTKIYADELSAGYVRKSPAQPAPGEDFNRLAAKFALELAKAALADKTSSGVSPVSALFCLGLIAGGTAGKTRAAFEAALGTDVEALSKGLQALADNLYSGKDCKVQTANSLWIKDDPEFKVVEQFLLDNAEYFSAQIYKTAFDDQALKDLNAWVKKNTDGMIDKIIDEFGKDDLMYLINTLLFDAKWENKYEKNDVRDATFTNYDGSTKEVKMLYSDEGRYLSDGKAEGFIKEYSGRDKDGVRVVDYAFVGLLPNEGTDVYEYLATLDGDAWTALINGQKSEKVHAGIPEFTAEGQFDLKEILSGMGYAELFAGDADLSALGSIPGGLYISDMQQKVKIEVDRNGTKAAAVTWAVVGKAAAAPVEEHYVILDRPFIYAIVDLQSGLPLFIGVQSNAG